MKIIFKKDNQNLFFEKWQSFLDKNPISFRYNLSFLEFKTSFKNEIIDKSFIVIKNHECIGICFLPIEKLNNGYSICLYNDYTISPLFINSKVEKVIFEQIDIIAFKYRIKQIKFYLDPLINHNNHNLLLKYKYIDSSSTTCLLNLEREKSTLWTSIRKHYKSMINKVLKDKKFEFIIMNKNNADYNLHEQYRELHYICAGKVTRKKISFDKQFEMLKLGYATLIALKYNDILIGMQYFHHFKEGVIYASGADNPKYIENGFNIYHPILWKAQLYFKEQGFKLFEYSQPCGYNNVQGFNDYLDDKQINISYFKRGMGADVVPLYRGIRYYEKKMLLSDIEQFNNKVNL